MINVLIADDHPLLRSGLRSEINRQTDLNVVAEAASGDEALQLTLDLRPDVLLLDVSMPGLRALDVLSQVKKQTQVKVLVLTAFGDLPTVVGMYKAGADGYLLKHEDLELVIQGVYTLAGGGKFYSSELPSMASVLSAGIPVDPTFGEHERLVLNLLNDGKSNKQIAYELSLSERTVEYHLKKVMTKLNVSSRLEVGMWLRSNPGFLTFPKSKTR